MRLEVFEELRNVLQGTTSLLLIVQLFLKFLRQSNVGYRNEIRFRNTARRRPFVEPRENNKKDCSLEPSPNLFAELMNPLEAMTLEEARDATRIPPTRGTAVAVQRVRRATRGTATWRIARIADIVVVYFRRRPKWYERKGATSA